MNPQILPHRSSTIQKVYLLEKQARGKNFLWQVFRHSWEGKIMFRQQGLPAFKALL